MPQFWTVIAFVMLFGFYNTSINVHIVPDAILAGMTPTAAANILAVSGAVMIPARLLLGSGGDRIGNRKILIMCFVVAAISLFWLSFIPANWGFFVFAVLMGFSTAGAGTCQSPLTAALFGLKSHGVIFGSIGFGFTIGAALGPYITGLLFDHTGSYFIAMLLSAGVSVLAIVAVYLVKPTAITASMTKHL
jgi:MFS family permease